MSKQMKVVMISLVVTLIVLFSGYQGFQYFKVKKPIQDVLQEQVDISIVDMKIEPGITEVQVHAKPNYNFINDFPVVPEQLNEKLGQDKWKITFTNTQTAKIKEAWREMVFGVVEGINTGKYTLVQSTVRQVTEKYHLQYGLYLDDQYLYLSLRDGNKSWFQILPVKAVK
jgi:hypothetical protein